MTKKIDELKKNPELPDEPIDYQREIALLTELNKSADDMLRILRDGLARMKNENK